MLTCQEVSDEINAMLDHEIGQILQRQAIRKAIRGVPASHHSFHDKLRLKELQELKRSFNDGWWIPKQVEENG